MQGFWSRLLSVVAIFAFVLFFSTPVYAQLESFHVNQTPRCAVADLATCANQGIGRLVTIYDADDTTDVSSGGGSVAILAHYAATAWKPLQYADEDQVTFNVVFCGQADENGTIYLGPVQGNDALFNATDTSANTAIAGAVCDALGNAAVASVDAPLFTSTAVKALGGVCTTDGTLAAGTPDEQVIFTLMDDTAAVTGVTCTIGAAAKSCTISTASTADLAAASKVAIRAVQNGDNADDNLWCQLTFAAQ